MASALITGVSGQDGGYLAEALLAEGLRVHGLMHDDDTSADVVQSRLPDLQLHRGDLQDSESIERVLHDVMPDEIYNLAGISSVAYSWVHPVPTADVSGTGVLRLVDAVHRLAEKTGQRARLVQASSAEIFGSPDLSPQNEDTPIRPVSPYGAAKAFGHHVVGVYRSRGVHACAAILYNHESPRRPPTFVTRKITQTVARIANGSTDPLVLGAIDVRRDWGWAPDYVDALIRIVRGAEATDYVVATGQSHSVADFVAAAFAHVNINDWQNHVRIDSALVRPADPAELVGDSSKLRALGWRPTVNFAEIAARMVDADLTRERR